MANKENAFSNARETISDLHKSLDRLLEDINSNDEAKESRALLVLLTIDIFITEKVGLEYWLMKIQEDLLAQKLKVNSLH